MNRIRPQFLCWNCERKFRVSVDLEGAPVLVVECPYCGEDCTVDLAPYEMPKAVVVRKDSPEAERITNYELPEPLPTIRPQKP